MPRYRGAAELEFAAAVINFRVNEGEWKDHEFPRFLNTFTSPTCEDRADCHLWFLALTGSALNRVGRTNEAIDRFEQIVDTTNGEGYFSYHAYRELGRLQWVKQGDEAAAYMSWFRASHIQEARGMFENMAVYHQTRDQFYEAEQLYAMARRVLERQRSAGTCRVASPNREEATFFTNRAVFYKDHAVAAHDTLKPRLQRKAQADIDSARNADSGYLDAYMSGAVIALAFSDYDLAVRRIEEARSVLRSPDAHGLARYREYDYERRAPGYLAWLELRAALERGASLPLPSEVVSRLSVDIPGLQVQPADAIMSVLRNMQLTGYTVFEDTAAVGAVSRDGTLLRAVKGW